MDIYYQQLINYQHKIKELEKIRLDAYNAEQLGTFYIEMLKAKKAIVFVAKANKEIVGASYVSDSLYSLYIEQLFVKSCYQNQKIGTNLLYYILKNKQLAENYFQHPLNISRLAPASLISERLYRRMGYEDTTYAITGTLLKRL
jgi:GNAT superfamily N-acetyltransferase